jgi:hypothetical protein
LSNLSFNGVALGVHSFADDVVARRPPFGLIGAASRFSNLASSGGELAKHGVLGVVSVKGVVLALVIGVANAKCPGVVSNLFSPLPAFADLSSTAAPRPGLNDPARRAPDVRRPIAWCDSLLLSPIPHPRMFVLADAPDDVDDLRRSLNQYLLLLRSVSSASIASSNATTASIIARTRSIRSSQYSSSSRAMRSVDRSSFVNAVCRRAG